jgi:Rrf2 family protein
MRQDSRLSRLLHVLLHMADQAHPITSEAIAAMLGTHAAAVRRTMAGLREAGYVRSDKGPGGGWTLAVPLSSITLLDVFQALAPTELFAFGLANKNPQCLVEQAVNASMEEALAQAEQTLLLRFGQIKLSDLAADFQRRSADYQGRAADMSLHPHAH